MTVARVFDIMAACLPGPHGKKPIPRLRSRYVRARRVVRRSTFHGILYDGIEMVDDRGDGEDAAQSLVQARRPWLTSSIGRHG